MKDSIYESLFEGYIFFVSEAGKISGIDGNEIQASSIENYITSLGGKIMSFESFINQSIKGLQKEIKNFIYITTEQKGSFSYELEMIDGEGRGALHVFDYEMFCNWRDELKKLRYVETL